jgi:hypothetical protein
MSGSRWATTDPLSLPRPRAERQTITGHATRSHPHPSPSQTGSRAASSPPRAGRNFLRHRKSRAAPDRSRTIEANGRFSSERQPGYFASTVARVAVCWLIECVGQFPLLGFIAPLRRHVTQDVVRRASGANRRRPSGLPADDAFRPIDDLRLLWAGTEWIEKQRVLHFIPRRTAQLDLDPDVSRNSTLLREHPKLVVPRQQTTDQHGSDAWCNAIRRHCYRAEQRSALWPAR